MELPKDKYGLSLTHNEHKSVYQSIEDFIDTTLNQICTWKNEESKKCAIETDDIWTLQWYPETTISFYLIAAPTLKELLELVEEFEGA